MNYAAKEIRFDEDARQSMLKGIEELADAVRVTRCPRIQRKLQLRIEKLGQYLLQMLESQTKAEKNNLKPGQSKAGRFSYPVNKSEFLYLDRLPSLVGTSTSSQTRGEIRRESKGKQKVLEGYSGAYPHPEADEPVPPLLKRLRNE